PPARDRAAARSAGARHRRQRRERARGVAAGPRSAPRRTLRPRPGAEPLARHASRFLQRSVMSKAERATPLICFAGLDWWYHNRAHADFQLMTRAARTRTVLLVNAIGMRMPLPGRTSHPF